MINILKKVNKILNKYEMDLAVITEDLDFEVVHIKFTVYNIKFTIEESATRKNKFCIYQYNLDKDSLNGIENVTKSEVVLIAKSDISDLYIDNNKKVV